MDMAGRLVDRPGRHRCLDIGCGAARNAVPLAQLGYSVVGVDLARPMLDAAIRRRAASGVLASSLALVQSPMTPLPFADASCDLIVAHGIWNLARSGREFRAAVAEAGRVASIGARLFVFTFSRHTLLPETSPDAGESFVFSSWNGEPACFLTEEELLQELGRVGFVLDGMTSLTEYNRPRPGELCAQRPPVIYEGRFRKQL
jgi:ubiquinone/menaquinone biosynthesis C-methylase UbiE